MMQSGLRLPLVMLAGLLMGAALPAAPVADGERRPIDLRRTTLIDPDGYVVELNQLLIDRPR